MKIKYISEEGLLTIKNNSDLVYKNVIENTRMTLMELFHNDNIIKNSAFEVEEFELDMSQEKPTLTDLENIKRVYNNMMHLSESQASDERIWTAYTLNVFKDYMKYRWETKSVKHMENRYFFNYSSKRSLIRNGIARLWWIGKYTYDSAHSDPYELTAFVCKDQDYIEQIFGSNLTNNPMIAKAVINALIDSQKAGKIVNRDVIRNLMKYINLLGGTYILDCLKYEEIYGKLKYKLLN